MSNQNRFTADELESLSLWESPGFPGSKAGTHQMPQPARPPSLTVDEIERMQQQAYDEAFAQGATEGREQGLVDGHAEGLIQGRTEGHAAGLEQGLQEANMQQQAMIAQFSALMAALSEPFKLLDETVEKQLVSLTIAIASQLVRREIKQNPGEIMAVVRAAVSVLPVAVQQLTLYLHPTDAELVRASLALTDSVTSWHIVEDPLLTQGGCIVSTDVSFVDATIEKRLAAVIAMVLGGEREHEHEPHAT